MLILRNISAEHWQVSNRALPTKQVLKPARFSASILTLSLGSLTRTPSPELPGNPESQALVQHAQEGSYITQDFLLPQ